MAIDEPGYTMEDAYAAFEITAPVSQSHARIATTAPVALTCPGNLGTCFP